ncbi:hypothetical protein [Mitsuaria sp. GD03876]|uniref:hypothetical protein n=1 Tax=Mitsuaria sp. GD03876 TaxID=2975399 RepID=UPI00244CDA45|nr:hypothetical protein [Mitsuaria sp. GD03876]MDH0863587.1 hypothetical protein [Mitsuaria sp. GD03876]
MTVLVDVAISAHDTRLPPALAAGNQTLNAFDVIPGPYSVTARRQLEAINRLIRLRDEGRFRPRPDEASRGHMRHDVPERMLAIYSKHRQLLEEPPGGGDVVAWIREFRDEDGCR